MFSAIHRLPLLFEDHDLEKAAHILTQGGRVAIPSSQGMLLLWNGASHSMKNEKSLGQEAFILSSKEDFYHIFSHQNFLTTQIPEKLLELPLSYRLPHPDFPQNGLSIRLAHDSLLQKLTELQTSPIQSLALQNEYGEIIRTPAEAARLLRSKVDLILQLQKEPPKKEDFAQAVLMRSGIAVKGANKALRQKLQKSFTRNLLFVCLGNLNRSPFAEKRLLTLMHEEARACLTSQEGWTYIPAWDPSSSGVIALPGTPSPSGMIQAAHRYNCTELLESHHSSPYRPQQGDKADIICPLGRNVFKMLKELAPPEKLFWQENHSKLPDPMGGSLAEYLDAAQAIEAFLEKFFLSPGSQPKSIT